MTSGKNTKNPRTSMIGLGFFIRKRFLAKILCLVVLGGVVVEEGGADVRTVTDQLGRRIAIPVRPERVVSLAPSITEIIFAIGQQSRLKGITRYSDYPPEGTANMPRVGSFTRLDVEKIISLKPDLCIGVKDGNPREVIERLQSLGIPVYAVNFRNIGSVVETIIEIGGLLDADEIAQRVVQKLQDRITRVKNRVAESTSRPGVFFQIGTTPIVSAGTDTFIHELITLSGGRNLTEGPIPYPRLSKEQVLALAPEVFIITSMTRGGAFEQVKAEWSRWTDMPAVRNNRIFLMESNILDRATPRLVDGLEMLARHIHPQLYEE